MKQVKKLTSAGELVKVTNTHELGIDLLTEIRRRKAELDVIENARKKNLQQVEIIKDYIKVGREKGDNTKFIVPLGPIGPFYACRILVEVKQLHNFYIHGRDKMAQFDLEVQ